MPVAAPYTIGLTTAADRISDTQKPASGESIWPKVENRPRLTTMVSAAANAAPAATPKVRPSIMSSNAGMRASRIGPTCLSTSPTIGTSSTSTRKLVQRMPDSVPSMSTGDRSSPRIPACHRKVKPTARAAAAPIAPTTTPTGWSSHWLTSYM